MTKEQKAIQDAETLVRQVLSQELGRQPTNKQVREVAERMAKAVLAPEPKLKVVAT